LSEFSPPLTPPTWAKALLPAPQSIAAVNIPIRQAGIIFLRSIVTEVM
jgi:hypothetical protein